MKKGIIKARYMAIAAIILICTVLVIVLNRQVPGLEKTKDILPRIGQEPVYVEMTDGEVLSATYTPARDMTVKSLKYLLVNTANGDLSGTGEAFLKISLYGADRDCLFTGEVQMVDIEAGSWQSLQMPVELSEGFSYSFEFEPVGCDPYFMRVLDYEPGISIGFETVTDSVVTYGDIFYNSVPIVIMAAAFAIVYILAGDRAKRFITAFAEKKSTVIVFNILFLVLLFVTLTIKIIKVSYIDGVYISADSDGYMREAVNLVKGNGFSYEGIAGYKSHFANWPIVYPLMIALVMLVTGTNAYLAGRIVAVLTITVIFAVLFAEYKEKAWAYSLAFTNIGFLGLCYYTWSEVPFILFMMLFALSLARIVKEDEPPVRRFVLLTVWGSLAFLTRYFGLFLWMVAGAYWLYLVIKRIRENGLKKGFPTRKITGLFCSGCCFGVIGAGYLMMNKIYNGYPTGVSRGTWWDDYASLTADLVDSLLVEIFNVFSLEVPKLLTDIGEKMSVWFIVLVAVMMVYCIVKCEKKDVRAMTLIVIAAAYYIIFILVRYRSSMDTFYFRFFAPATVLLVMGLIGLVSANALSDGKAIRVIAVFSMIFTVILCASYAAEIPEWGREATAFDVVARDWDQSYSEIPYRSAVIWSDLDYRSTWYRPDVYSGELFEGDTWESLSGRYYASESIVIKKTDAQALIESGSYDKSVIERLQNELASSSGNGNKYLVIPK